METTTAPNGAALVPDERQALAPANASNALEQLDLEQLSKLERWAKVMVQSALFKVAPDPETAQAQAVVKVMYGAELGLTPFVAMKSIHVFESKGRVSFIMDAQLMLTLARRRGYDWRATELEDGWEIRWYRGHPAQNDLLGVSTFTLDDARQANLLTKDGPWQGYRKDMLFWRCTSRGIKRYCPDATNGVPVYVPGEVEEAEESLPLPATDVEADEPAGPRRALPLTPADFAPEEKVLVMLYLTHFLAERKIIPPQHAPSKANVATFFNLWHPRTKAELLSEAAQYAEGRAQEAPEAAAEAEAKAEAAAAKAAEPEQADERPTPGRPEPMRSKASKKKSGKSLFGGGD